MKVSPGAQGPGARKGHVTGAESQQEKGGDVWLRAVLGRGREGGLLMRPPPGRYASKTLVYFRFLLKNKQKSCNILWDSYSSLTFFADS